jgi:hypothetical protein
LILKSNDVYKNEMRPNRLKNIAYDLSVLRNYIPFPSKAFPIRSRLLSSLRVLAKQKIEIIIKNYLFLISGRLCVKIFVVCAAHNSSRSIHFGN